MTVPGFPTAFRGSTAVAAGLVTWSLLRGSQFDRLLPDVYGLHQDQPRDLAMRSRAAYRWGGERGVLAGYSAAELLGADCAPIGAPADLVVPGGGLRSRDGVMVRRDRLHPGEITTVGDVRTTTPMRTAFDLGCRSGLVEGVVAVDALARVHGFPPDLLLNFAVRYPRARGVYRFTDVLSFSDRRSGSPMESRLRLLLVLAGLPRPVVQHLVPDDVRLRVVWLDLAYPEHRVGIEYDGGDHLRPDQVRKDIARHTRLVAAGWRVFRYTSSEIRHERVRIVADVAAALALNPAELRLR